MFGINAEFNINTKRGWAIFSDACRGIVRPPEELSSRGAAGLAPLSGFINALPLLVRETNDRQLVGVEAMRAERVAVFLRTVSAVTGGELELLETVPFVRPVLALCFLSEVGLDPRRRFNGLRSIVAYSGFDPSKRVSADKVTSHLPTRGARHMRRAFLQAAASAMMNEGPLQDYGRSVADRTGKFGWRSGRNAVGRKLVRWCSAVLLSRKPFSLEIEHGWKVEINDGTTGEADPTEAGFEDGDSAGDDRELVGPDEGVAPAPGWDGH